jgi:hypothetical protein
VTLGIFAWSEYLHGETLDGGNALAAVLEFRYQLFMSGLLTREAGKRRLSGHRRYSMKAEHISARGLCYIVFFLRCVNHFILSFHTWEAKRFRHRPQDILLSRQLPLAFRL